MNGDRANPPPLVGKLSEFQPLSFDLVSGTDEEATWDELVRTWHYLGYDQMIGPRLKYIVRCQDMPVAAISFNRAALRVGVRDAYLGWDPDGKLSLLAHVVNNNRYPNKNKIQTFRNEAA